MCSSATGSFTAAGVLAGIGAASLARAAAPPLRMMAAVPLLFAAQQAAEGVVWLTVHDRPPSWVGFAMAAVTATLLVLTRPEAHVTGHHIAYDFSVGSHRRNIVPLLFYVLPTAHVGVVLLRRAPERADPGDGRPRADARQPVVSLALSSSS